MAKQKGRKAEVVVRTAAMEAKKDAVATRIKARTEEKAKNIVMKVSLGEKGKAKKVTVMQQKKTALAN